MPSIHGFATGRYLQHLKFFEDGLHGALGVTEKFRAADACEDPAHAFENGLAVHVFGELFERAVTVTIALDGQTFAVTFDDQIHLKSPNSPLRCHAISSVR